MKRHWLQLLASLGMLALIVGYIAFHGFLKDWHYEQIPLNEITIEVKKKPLPGTLKFALRTCMRQHEFGHLKILITCHNKARAMYRTDM